MAIPKTFRNQIITSSFPIEDGEENLIQSAVRGGASAFGQLYDFYQPKIYRFILVKVGQREEAEDLTHQVFLNAWQNIKNYRSRGFPFSSWLYRIARNQVIDYYRARREMTSIDQMDPEYFIAPAIQHFTVEKDLELEKIFGAVRKLEPVYQDVVMMRFVEDLSIKETAGAIGKSEGAVKLIQHRAIKKLQELIS